MGRLRPCARSAPASFPPESASQVWLALMKVDALADVNNRLQASLAEATSACRGERAKRDNLHKQVCPALPPPIVCSSAGQQVHHLQHRLPHVACQQVPGMLTGPVLPGPVLGTAVPDSMQSELCIPSAQLPFNTCRW